MNCEQLNDAIEDIQQAISNSNRDWWQGAATWGGGMLGMFGTFIGALESGGATLLLYGAAAVTAARGVDEMEQQQDILDGLNEDLDDLCRQWRDQGCEAT
ncbi:MAG: hypothetical protein AAFZ63_17870 [Bacteroidota bacterium]